MLPQLGDRKIRVVHGNTLTAAAVWQAVPKQMTRVPTKRWIFLGGYNPYKRPYHWVTGVIVITTLLIWELICFWIFGYFWWMAWVWDAGIHMFWMEPWGERG